MAGSQLPRWRLGTRPGADGPCSSGWPLARSASALEVAAPWDPAPESSAKRQHHEPETEKKIQFALGFEPPPLGCKSSSHPTRLLPPWRLSGRQSELPIYTIPDFGLGASRPTHYGFCCTQVQMDPGGRFRALGPISSVQDGFDGVPDRSRAGSFWMCRFFAIGALSVSPLGCPGRL